MGSKSKSQILLVATGSDLESRLRSQLRAKAYRVGAVERGDEGLAKALQLNVDVVVCAIDPPGLSGLDLLARLHPVKPNVRVILLNDSGNNEEGSRASTLGVYQVLSKPFDIPQLLESIRRAALSNQEVLSALDLGEAEFGHTGLIGTSQLMRDVYKQIGFAADFPDTVLILGPTGTGKELIARALHQLGNRAKQPFIAINCNVFPDGLFESELFGHERGAFTGAGERHLGLFERAHRGTLFLDEIGDLHLAMQVKLLRFLEEHLIQRLGGAGQVPLDLKIIAATHCDLPKSIQREKFREDLYYRLSAFTIRSPALKDRPEDILDLVRRFLRQFHNKTQKGAPSIRREAVEFLERQPWPGNVRQLQHSVQRAALLAQGQPIALSHVQQACEAKTESANPARRAGEESLTDLFERARTGELKHLRAGVLQEKDRSLVTRAIAIAKGNLTKVAKLLGITRVTARHLARKFGLLLKK